MLGSARCPDFKIVDGQAAGFGSSVSIASRAWSLSAATARSRGPRHFCNLRSQWSVSPRPSTTI